jgi:hypothetical protein
MIFDTTEKAQVHCLSHAKSGSPVSCLQYVETLSESSDCPFCGIRIEASQAMLKSHLGQHMDEIAFAVLTKPYKEWEFYSEALSSKAMSIKSGSSAA